MNDTKPIQLSACVVVVNEERVIERCLQSIAGAVNEIILVHDGPCRDKTLEIAERFGAKIIIAPRAGVAEPIRPLSYEAAQGEWILQIDADEFLSPELRAALPELVGREGVDAYECIWPLFDGTNVLTRSWPYKRFMFRKSAMSFLGAPNFVVEVPGKVERLNFILEHRPEYNNYSWAVFLKKWRGWSAIQSELFLRDFRDMPKFQYRLDSWPRNIRLRRRFPLLIMLPDALIVFLKTLASGAWKKGGVGYKAALFLALSRIHIDWGIWRGKHQANKAEQQALCPCGHSSYKKYWYDLPTKTLSVLQCRHCGLARSWPIPLEGQALETYYEEQTDYEGRFDRETLWKEFFGRTLRLIKRDKPDGKLLDVGSNLGYFVDEARQAGFKAVGIDMAEQAVKYGRQKYALSDQELLYGTIQSLNFSPETFDVVTYLHCFEHIEFPNKELSDVKSILKKDGILFIEVPRFYSAWRFLLGRRWYGFSPYQHIWQFGLRGLRGLLERNGYKIIRSYTRINMHHEFSFSVRGILKSIIGLIAYLTGTGDNLIVVARKK